MEIILAVVFRYGKMDGMSPVREMPENKRITRNRPSDCGIMAFLGYSKGGNVLLFPDFF